MPSLPAGTFPSTYDNNQYTSLEKNPGTGYLTTVSGSVEGSTSFDGGEDYLLFPNSGTSSDLVIGSNDFTLEFWIKANSFSNGGVIYDTRDGHANSLMINFNTSGNLRVYANSGYRITADGISTGVWTHYAIVRDSGTTKLFLNGIQDDETYTDSNNYTGNKVFIGRHQSGVNVADFDGYISNLRLIVGTALYPPDPLGSVPGTPQGTGSCFFDGIDDHIELVTTDSPGSRILDNAANFTVEAWAYFTDASPADENNIFEFSTGDRLIFGRRKLANGRTCMYMYSSATSDLFVDDAAHNIPSNQWVHLAWVKSGTNMRMFKNGANVVGNNQNSATNMPSNVDAAVIHIGENYDGNEPMKGYISNVRFSTVARYTSDFNVPTGPFENDTDTPLIICHRGDQIKDIIGRYSPSANGGVSASYSSPFIESPTSLNVVTNTKLLTCQNDAGNPSDASTHNHSVHVNSNAAGSTENPFGTGGLTSSTTSSFRLMAFDSAGSSERFNNSGTIYSRLSNGLLVRVATRDSHAGFELNVGDSDVAGAGEITPLIAFDSANSVERYTQGTLYHEQVPAPGNNPGILVKMLTRDSLGGGNAATQSAGTAYAMNIGDSSIGNIVGNPARLLREDSANGVGIYNTGTIYGDVQKTALNTLLSTRVPRTNFKGNIGVMADSSGGGVGGVSGGGQITYTEILLNF